MTKFKKVVVAATMALTVMATGVTAFAAYSTPAEAVAEITGKSVEAVLAERTTGKTYGTIALEAGKLAEYQEAMLQFKQEILKERVAAGTLTQEQADAIIAAIEQNQLSCDGTGTGMGAGMGAAFGGGACGGTGAAFGGGAYGGTGTAFGGMGAGRAAGGRGFGAYGTNETNNKARTFNFQ